MSQHLLTVSLQGGPGLHAVRKFIWSLPLPIFCAEIIDVSVTFGNQELPLGNVTAGRLAIRGEVSGFRGECHGLRECDKMDRFRPPTQLPVSAGALIGKTAFACSEALTRRQGIALVSDFCWFQLQMASSSALV
jgi:hypothetical protein